jgi:hypothetical protein
MVEGNVRVTSREVDLTSLWLDPACRASYRAAFKAFHADHRRRKREREAKHGGGAMTDGAS